MGTGGLTNCLNKPPTHVTWYHMKLQTCQKYFELIATGFWKLSLFTSRGQKQVSKVPIGYLRRSSSFVFAANRQAGDCPSIVSLPVITGNCPGLRWFIANCGTVVCIFCWSFSVVCGTWKGMEPRRMHHVAKILREMIPKFNQISP